jgi:ParB family chromosome partitioning protein
MTTEVKDGFRQSLGTLQSILSNGKSKDGDASGGKGMALELAIDRILEDPEQPRTEFDDGFLAWLAEDIRKKGVKTPISVRPEKNGHYIINHGACRLRASKLAGKATIPAFIDTEYDPYDQISENIKRKSLSARDIAKWIKKRILAGESRRDVQKKLDVGNQYITNHLAILSLPDEIMSLLYDTGICREQHVLYELQLCHKKDAAATLSYCQRLADTKEVTLKAIRHFKAGLAKPRGDGKDGPVATGTHKSQPPAKPPAKSKALDDVNFKKPHAASDTIRNPVVRVKYDRKMATLLIHKRPTAAEMVWIQYENGNAGQVAAAQVQIQTISEGEQ